MSVADDVVDEIEPQAPEVEPAEPGKPYVAWSLVAVTCIVVLAGIGPDVLLTDSMPIGTDLVGHAVVPWIDATNISAILPGSWSQAMFNGFPVNQLYPWLPSFLAGLMSYVVPLAVAMKLITAIPLVLLPWSAYRAGRWAGIAAGMSAMLAVGLLPFIFSTHCGYCGGNLQSTVNGEYSFAWGLVFAILATGAIDRLARDGSGAVLAATLTAATAFSHPLTTVWLLISVFVIAVGREVWTDRERLRRFGIAAGLAFLLSSFWWIPYLTTRSWALPNGLVRDAPWQDWLAPASVPWEIGISAFALLGAVHVVRQRMWVLIAYLVGALVAVAAFFRFSEVGPFYSPRATPFYDLARWELAAVGFAVAVSWLVARWRTRGMWDDLWAPVVWLVVSVAIIGTTWGWWAVSTPATTSKDGTALVLGWKVPITAVSAFHPVLAGSAARTDYDKLTAVQNMIKEVAAQRGCGSMMWDDGDPQTEGGPVFGDAAVFWQSAIWTGGCIVSADGVLVDSSQTAPAMQMTKSLVSQTTQALVPSAPTYAYNLTLGVQRMQEMGIRFYLTHGGTPASDAQKTQGLQLVATTGPWQMWEIDQGVPVSSLSSLPAVFEPELSNNDWTGVSTRYFTTPTFGTVPLAQTGPVDWPAAGLTSLPKETPTDRAKVSKILVEDGKISFHVENVGTPVWVRISDFPGWIAQGAEGPYRVTPNYMVVVPTSNDVVVTKERTPADWIGMLFFFTGLGLAVGLAVYDAMVRRGWPALPDDLEDDEDWDADQDWDADDLDETESSAEAAADEPEAVDEGTTSTTQDGAATSR